MRYITTEFPKKGEQLKQMTQVVPPNKQRSMPKVRQSSPLKMRDTRPSVDDCIDLEIQQVQKQIDKDLYSDPSVQKRVLRQPVKRNYRDMLEGNDTFKQTLLDEQIEIR